MMKIWAWLRNNLGTILNVTIVVIGIVIVWLDMTGMASLEAVREATLALLSLIGASLLMNYATNSQLQQAIKDIRQMNQEADSRLQQAIEDVLQKNQEGNGQLQRTLEGILKRLSKPSVDQVLLPHAKWMDEIDRRLWLAKEVWVLSRTCIRIWQDYNDQLNKLLKAGGDVRLMLVDPNEGAQRLIVESAQGFEHYSDFKLRRAIVEGHLAQLAWRCSQPEWRSLQVRTVNYLPAWTLILIDPQDDIGIIYVELATFCAGPRNRPTFSLMAKGDTRLFELFRDEFNIMWNRAQPVAPAALAEKQ